MAELSFNPGEPVFLNVHLQSNATDRHVLAIVQDGNGTELGRHALQSVGKGSYYNFSDFKMPNLPFVVSIYKIFTDENFQTPSDEDADAVSIFVRRDVAQKVGARQQIGQTVVKNFSTVAQIEAKQIRPQVSARRGLAAVIAKDPFFSKAPSRRPAVVGFIESVR